MRIAPWIQSLLLLVLLAATACAPTFNVTMGQMPPQDPGAMIEAGMTTRDEVIEMFGQPDFTGIDADGLEKWTWAHMGVQVKAGKEANITSFFNMDVSFPGDLVDSYSYSKKAE